MAHDNDGLIAVSRGELEPKEKLDKGDENICQLFRRILGQCLGARLISQQVKEASLMQSW